jgi:hypothetical protein
MRNADSICADVDRGLVVVAQLKQLKDELKSLEERLKQDALDRPDEHEPLVDEEREGRQFIAVGTELRLPIVITADKLVQSFTAHSKVHTRIEPFACGKLLSFFAPTTTYEAIEDDGKAFRALAVELLGEQAPRFIAACRSVDRDGIPKSDVKVEWQQAAAHAKLEEAAEPALA